MAVTFLVHVFAGGPELYGPIRESSLSMIEKSTWSVVWHFTSLQLLLVSIVLFYLSRDPNNALFTFVFATAVGFAALFMGYGMIDLGSVWPMPQWRIVLLVFVTAHLGNHVALFWGADHHLAVQEALRPFYRYPLVEPLILLGLFVQLFLGARILIRRGWPRRGWARVQMASGAILLLFLVQHVGAALYAEYRHEYLLGSIGRAQQTAFALLRTLLFSWGECRLPAHRRICRVALATQTHRSLDCSVGCRLRFRARRSAEQRVLHDRTTGALCRLCN